MILHFIGAWKFDVIWLHNNKEIKPSKDFQYTNEANIYKLNIAEIFRSYKQTYNHYSLSFMRCYTFDRLDGFVILKFKKMYG